MQDPNIVSLGICCTYECHPTTSSCETINHQAIHIKDRNSKSPKVLLDKIEISYTKIILQIQQANPSKSLCYSNLGSPCVFAAENRTNSKLMQIYPVKICINNPKKS